MSRSISFTLLVFLSLFAVCLCTLSHTLARPWGFAEDPAASNRNKHPYLRHGFGYSQKLIKQRVAQLLKDRLKGDQRISTEALAQHLLHLCNHHQIDPTLILAIIETESRFHVSAVSHKRAHGLMQLKLATANEMSRRMRGVELRERDLHDPYVNLTLGVSYLMELRSRYKGAVTDALSAYNMGPAQWDRLKVKGSRYAREVKIKQMKFLDIPDV